MLSVRDVTFSYGDNTALAHCSFSVAPGEIVGLIGRNGAGKSTLMKLAVGNLEPNRGSITVNDAPPDSQAARTSTMFIASNDYLPTFMTGYEYLTMLAKLYDCHLSRETIDSYYVRYGMAHRAGDLIEDYSHGMRKKLQLISAFVFCRPLTLIDETLNGIDVDASLETQKDIQRLASEGSAIVLCSHDFSYVEKMCHRVVMLDMGSIIDEIAAPDYAHTPGSLEAWVRGIIDSSPSEAEELWLH